MASVPSVTAIYARVSSHRQQKQATIESQITELRARVTHDGHPLYEEYILVDDGHSGSYLDRPGLDRLRDLARDGHIRRVYVHSPDRLARRYAHQAILLDELERAGCEVIFLNQPPSPDPEGQLLVQIQGVIAEYERAKIAERLRRGKLHRARQGIILSWKAPYGYRYVLRQAERPGGWEIDESEATMVRTLFGWVYEEALSVRMATRRLNASAWRPREGGNRWAPSAVRAILRNKTYTGVSYFNKYRWIESDRTDPLFRKTRRTRCVARPHPEWIPIPVPPLVDEMTFAKVQEQLKRNRTFARRNLRRDEEYLLRCLVKCGVCGHTMVAHSYGKHTYYDCGGGNNALATTSSECCPARSVYAPELDRLVWDQIDLLLRSPQMLLDAFQQQKGTRLLSNPDVVDAELERLQKQITGAQRQLQRLIDGFQTGLIRAPELQKRRSALEEQITGWAQQQQVVESQRPAWRENKAVSENLTAFCTCATSALHHPTFAEKQKLLRLLIECVVVTAWEAKIKLTIPLSANFDLTPQRIHFAEDAQTVFQVSP